MKYRKKPVVIEAVQWRGDIESNIEIIKLGLSVEPVPLTDILLIETLEGKMKCDVWDYVIKGVKGEFYPCKPDIFEMTYEKVVDEI